MTHPKPQTPALTVDIIIELPDLTDKPIVLIERKYEPFGWAIPGGFVDIGETVQHAACREAAEETNLDVKLTQLLACYSDPKRDPRGHTVSIVYIANGYGDPMAKDDAKSIGLFTVEQVPKLLAFDHQRILQDYFEFRENGILPTIQSS